MTIRKRFAFALGVALLSCGGPRAVRVQECLDDRECDSGERCAAGTCEVRDPVCVGDDGCVGRVCLADANGGRCVAEASELCRPDPQAALGVDCVDHHDCARGSICLASRCRRALDEAERGYLRTLGFPGAAAIDIEGPATAKASAVRNAVLSWSLADPTLELDFFVVALMTELPAVTDGRVVSYDRVTVAHAFPDDDRRMVTIGQMRPGPNVNTEEVSLSPGAYSWVVLGFSDLRVVAASNVRALVVEPPSGTPVADPECPAGCTVDAQGQPTACVTGQCRRLCASDDDCVSPGAAEQDAPVRLSCVRPRLGETDPWVCIAPEDAPACRVGP